MKFNAIINKMPLSHVASLQGGVRLAVGEAGIVHTWHLHIHLSLSDESAGSPMLPCEFMVLCKMGERCSTYASCRLKKSQPPAYGFKGTRVLVVPLYKHFIFGRNYQIMQAQTGKKRDGLYLRRGFCTCRTDSLCSVHAGRRMWRLFSHNLGKRSMVEPAVLRRAT